MMNEAECVSSGLWVVRGLKARPVIARAEGPGTRPERFLEACKAGTKRIKIMKTHPLIGAYAFLPLRPCRA
jgi:hypothetical protein